MYIYYIIIIILLYVYIYMSTWLDINSQLSYMEYTHESGTYYLGFGWPLQWDMIPQVVALQKNPTDRNQQFGFGTFFWRLV